MVAIAVDRVHGWRALYKSRPAKLQTMNDSPAYVRDSDSRLTIWQESGPYCSTIISSIADHRGARRVFAPASLPTPAVGHLTPLRVAVGDDRLTRCERRAVMHCHAPTPFARSSLSSAPRTRVEPKFDTFNYTRFGSIPAVRRRNFSYFIRLVSCI